MICKAPSMLRDDAGCAFCLRMLFRYPAKMIPGCHITIHTSAATDADARLLLTALGIPFYGKHVD